MVIARRDNVAVAAVPRDTLAQGKARQNGLTDRASATLPFLAFLGGVVPPAALCLINGEPDLDNFLGHKRQRLSQGPGVLQCSDVHAASSLLLK